MKFRPAAIPLITVDPFFSVWSESDTLNSGITRHWTGKPAQIVAGLCDNDRFYPISCVNGDNIPEYNRMHQKKFSVTPLSTVYEFENEFAKVTLTFTTPLLQDRLNILTRPVSYVEYNIEKKCNVDKQISFVFGVCANLCTDSDKAEVEFKKNKFSVSCGNVVQKPLSKSGDCVTIDWGYLHLCDADAYVTQTPDNPNPEDAKDGFSRKYNAYTEKPYIVVKKDDLSGVITLAYDEIKPIEYFGEALDECWHEEFDSFDDMINAAKNEYAEIKKLCNAFDEKLLNDAGKYGENYKKLISLAYRQAIAAHKTVKDKDGNILFLSKECGSNGCIGTLDVTYPSIPLFLKYNPELVKGMLRPIIKFADSDAWKFDFVPHDVGQYPLANGQVYGDDIKSQMPVEESGNMLLCLAAVQKYSGGDSELFESNRELMKKWVQFLVEFGYDPGSQLCTDDFAGHLDHNCNLSLKAILGIASYAQLSGDSSYMDIAKEYAQKWEKDALASHGGTRLTFDNPDGWSLKYNMVWDNLLGFNLFSDKIKKNEIATYATKMHRYGVPLDSRADYTKLDWLVWSTCIYDDKEYFDAVCESVLNMINETPDRTPLTDWYDTCTAIAYPFRNRTVVGGVFINLLENS